MHPSAEIPVQLGGRAVPLRVVDAVWGFFAVYVGVFMVLMLAMMATGLDQVTAFSAIAATLNNLGPGLGGVAMNYASIGTSRQVDLRARDAARPARDLHADHPVHGDVLAQVSAAPDLEPGAGTTARRAGRLPLPRASRTEPWHARSCRHGHAQALQRGFAVLATAPAARGASLVRRGARLARHRQFEGRRWTLPARVYAQPIDLYAGQQLSAQRFVDELERLGYLAAANPDRPGTYRRRGEQVSVHVRDFRFADGPQPAQRAAARVRGNAIASLADAQGAEVPVFRLDPLLIGSIFPIHGEDRIVVAPDEVPPLLPAALKAVEDRKFDSHHGVNPLAILRALFVNVRAGQIEQGGSTLTQQLVKSYFLDSRRTLRRKAEEAVMAVILESRFEKATS